LVEHPELGLNLLVITLKSVPLHFEVVDSVLLLTKERKLVLVDFGSRVESYVPLCFQLHLLLFGPGF